MNCTCTEHQLEQVGCDCGHEENSLEQTTTVLSGRRHEVEKMLGKFAKKATRYGVPFDYSFGESYEQERKEQTTDMWYPNGVRTYTVSVVDVTITGEKPVVGDYEFLASVEFAGDAGNFVDMVPGVELPEEYRTTDDRCEHCHAARRRKNVFVVRNRNSGKLLQVGRTCLRDFLGTDDPKWIVQRFKFFREFKGWAEEESFGGFGGGRHLWATELRKVLGISLASIRIWGWVSKGQARFDESLTPTVNRYHLYCAKTDEHNREAQQKLKDEIRPTDYDTAEQIIAWVRGNEENSDYMWNLKLAMRDDVLTDPKRLGLSVSAVSAWHRHVDRELKRAKQKELNVDSKHVGEVGERLRGVKVRLEMRRGLGDNGWGWSEMLKLRDENGNLFTWFTGSEPSVDIGEDFVIDATVKAHKDFNGVSETQITRAKVVS